MWFSWCCRTVVHISSSAKWASVFLQWWVSLMTSGTILTTPRPATVASSPHFHLQSPLPHISSTSITGCHSLPSHCKLSRVKQNKAFINSWLSCNMYLSYTNPQTNQRTSELPVKWTVCHHWPQLSQPSFFIFHTPSSKSVQVGTSLV